MIAVLGVSLALGLAASAFSYLGSSLAIPGPARAATTEELRERGAEVFYEFCSWPKFEPRFWPECRNGADEWRARGATRLVEFCTRQVPSRMFSASDCEGEERPPVALTAAPRPEDLVMGGIVAALALTVLLPVTATYRVLRPHG